jgi:hypothetical protein
VVAHRHLIAAHLRCECWRLKIVTICNITKLILFWNFLTVSMHLNKKLHHTVFILKTAKVALLILWSPYMYSVHIVSLIYLCVATNRVWTITLKQIYFVEKGTEGIENITLLITSNPLRLRLVAVLIIKCFSVILCMLYALYAYKLSSSITLSIKKNASKSVG